MCIPFVLMAGLAAGGSVPTFALHSHAACTAEGQIGGHCDEQVGLAMLAYNRHGVHVMLLHVARAACIRCWKDDGLAGASTCVISVCPKWGSTETGLEQQLNS